MESYTRTALSLFFLLIALTPSVLLADSPPNLSADINWVDSGGEYASERGVYNASFGGVTDVELAFNRARREEETQLGLAAGTLGDLDLPPQAAWDGMSDDAKALYLINAERTARADMRPGVIGLPLAGIERHIDAISQAYGNRLHDYDLQGHYHDGTPSSRIEKDPVIGSLHGSSIDYPADPSQNDPTQVADPTTWQPTHRDDGSRHYFADDHNGVSACHEFLTRSENLAYYASTAPIRMPIERSIYSFIYDDSSAHWGHREAVLLQDKALGYEKEPAGFTGFDNNHGSSTSEGYMGFFVRSSNKIDQPNSFYEPFKAQGDFSYGTVVVMDMFDPVADNVSACTYDITLRSEEVPSSDGKVALLAVDDSVSTSVNTAVVISPLNNDIGTSIGDSIALTAKPGHGSATLTDSTHIQYLPAASFTGEDSLRYRVTSNDGKNTSSATIKISVGSSATATDSRNNAAVTTTQTSTTTDTPTENASTPSGGGTTSAILLSSLLALRQRRRRSNRNHAPA